MNSQLILNDLEKVKDELFKFIWEYKHGDNILYNFEILYALYSAKKAAIEPSLFNKPITIFVVSIIESILIDFLDRLDEATSHLPKNVNKETLGKIKVEINQQKKPFKIKGLANGDKIYRRRKMYHFNELVKIFRKYELFGLETDQFYNELVEFGEMRNRVHIENYHENFEADESDVFTGERVEKLESVLVKLWGKMVTDYQRPWTYV